MTDYGIDLAGVDDLDPTGREVTGRMVLLESIARRYQTPRGTLFGFPEDGLDLRKYISGKATPRSLERIKVEILDEARKDQRVLSASMVRWEFVPTGAQSKLSFGLELHDADGPFTMTVTATSDSVAAIMGLS